MSTNVKTNVFADYQSGQPTWAAGIETVDIRKGNTWGFLPSIGGMDSGKNIQEWMYNTPYLRRDLIAIVLETPKGFDYLPNPKMWHEAVRSLFEIHAKTIEGLDGTLTVESTEQESGLNNQKIKTPSNVTIAESNVTLGGIVEKYGIPIEILLDTWIRYLFMDPNTKAPLITTLPKADKITVYDPTYWACSVIFIEPDVLLRKAVHGWVVTNLYPQAGVEVKGSKDKTSGRELKEISIEMGGLAMPTTNIKSMALANKILTSLKLYNLSPDDTMILPISAVTPGLASSTEATYEPAPVKPKK